MFGEGAFIDLELNYLMWKLELKLESILSGEQQFTFAGRAICQMFYTSKRLNILPYKLYDHCSIVIWKHQYKHLKKIQIRAVYCLLFKYEEDPKKIVPNFLNVSSSFANSLYWQIKEALMCSIGR